MKTSQTMTRLLSLAACVAALSACGGNSGGSSGSDSATESATGGETDGSTSNPTVNPSDPTQTSNEPTSTMGGTGNSGTDTVTTTDTATDTGSTTDPVDTDSSTTGAPAVCGDGKIEGTEACDDGNVIDGDGCEADCTISPAVCGNEVVEVGEVCDDGNQVDGDECSADCTMVTVDAVCGNGIVEGTELCDDNNQVDGDGCESDCTISPPVCGNMKVEGAEDCDDGNKVNGGPGDFCKNDCTVFVPASCSAPAMYTNCDDNLNLADKDDKKNALKAIGVCDGDPATSVVTTDFQFESNNNAAWQVAKGFGTHKIDNKLLYSPREGSAFLMVSTGVIKAPDAQGIVTEAANSQVGNGNNNNNDTDALPAPFQVKVGSADGVGGTPFQKCDGVNDCSDTLQAQWTKGNNNPNDRLWFTFKTKVPLGTFGYTFDFVFCSSEWPTYVDTGFNDMLIAYQVDPTADDPNAVPPIDPYTGNVTFIPDPNDPAKGLPLTITALDPYLSTDGYSLAEPQLFGTGFESHACSDWFKAKGGVQPGAEITIGFYIADMSDSVLATLAILDNFRWDCEGCVPSEVDDCGVQEPM
jgi:cysteine-rich repeat protein